MTEKYKYVKATVSDGELSLEYRLEGALVTGRDGHDEDVSGWTDREIVNLACGMLGIEDADRDVVEVIWD
jgi:hypothetical protein